MVTKEKPRDAAARAAELQNHSNTDSGSDEFFVERGIIPDEWSYEWKMWTVLGAEDPHTKLLWPVRDGRLCQRHVTLR